MKRIISILILIFTAGVLFGQEVWEGNAAMSRYGEFPSSGLYGASDSFTRNTVVTVENIENGKKTTVIIVDRLDDPGLFILLSKEAAQALGIAPDQFARTRVVLADSGSRLSVNDSDRALHNDPDINPSARITDEDLDFLQKYLKSDEPLVPDPDARPDFLSIEEADDPGTDAASNEVVAVEEPVVEEPEIEETPVFVEVEPEPVIVEPVAEIPPVIEPPVENLSDTPELTIADFGTAAPELETVPPGQDIPRLARDPAAVLTIEDTAADPDVTEAPAVVADVPDLPEDRRRAELVAQELYPPEPDLGDTLADIVPEAPVLVLEAPVEPGPVVTAVPEPETESVVTLEKAEPRPPVAEIQPEPPVVAVVVPPFSGREGEIRLVERLDTSSHYLQVGAFREEFSARSAAGKFDRRYPVMLHQRGDMFRVLLGPLSPDESGAMLATVKAMGYRDAFIQRGN